MTKRDNFRDKLYIMNCDMPSELFTVKGIKSEYRALAKIWHPDVAEAKEALFIMSKINALYKEGQNLITQNKFYEKERLLKGVRNRDKHPEEKVDFREYSEKPRRSVRKKCIEIKASSGKNIRFKYLKRVMIELGFMYISEEHFMLEIAKVKRLIFMDAVEIIKRNSSGYFKIEIPKIIDNFESETHGYIVFKKQRGVEPITVLESVMGYLKPLGSRKICEGIFYDLTALKYMGLTSTGLNKDLWFIDVDTGKLHNYGLFFYLHEFSSRLSRAPKGIYENLVSLKPTDNEELMIKLVKSEIVTLNKESGLKVDDFHKWVQNLDSNSLEVSLAESRVFNRAIASVTTHGFDLDAYYQSIS